MAILTLIVCATLAQSSSSVLDAAWTRFWRHMAVEGAGIFWIAAEFGILFAVMVGLRVLRERPLPERIVLTRAERRRGWFFALVVVFLIAGVFGRFLIWTPMPVAVEAAGALQRREIQEAVRAIVYGHTEAHLAIWCAFIGIWVALEIAIVVYGVRAFHALAALTGTRTAESLPTAGLFAVSAMGAWFWSSDASAEFSLAIEHVMQMGYRGAVDDARVLNRFAEFIVRVAGAGWIAVEWVAAIYLVRGVAMLRRFFRESGRVN